MKITLSCMKWNKLYLNPVIDILEILKIEGDKQ